MKNESVRYYNKNPFTTTAKAEMMLVGNINRYSRTQTSKIRKIIAQLSEASTSKMGGNQNTKHLHTLFPDRQVQNSRRRRKTEETRRAECGSSPADVNRYTVTIARQGILANELIPPEPVKVAEHNLEAIGKMETSQVLPQQCSLLGRYVKRIIRSLIIQEGTERTRERLPMENFYFRNI